MKIGVLFDFHPSDPTWSHTRIFREMGRALVRRGDTYVAFVPYRDEPRTDPWEGIPIVPVRSRHVGGRSRLLSLDFPHRVAPLLDKSFDAVISTGELGGARLFRRARELGVLGVDFLQGVAPKFLAHAERDSLRGKLGLALERTVLPRLEARHTRACDLVVAPSSRNREHLLRLYHLPSEKIEVLPNGSDPVPPISPEERAAARAALGLGSDRFYLAFIGHDWRRKGLDILRESVASLDARGVPATILNMGSSGGRSRTEIDFGVVKDLEKRRIFAASDVFAFPTRYEGSPLPVPEAAQMGLPIVTTPEASVELGRPGTDYLSVPAGDVGALAGALEQLYRHPEEAKAMGERGRSTFASWTWESEALALRGMIERAISRRKGTPSGQVPERS